MIARVGDSNGVSEQIRSKRRTWQMRMSAERG